ncbi:transmembrane emp24 domain-containing protein 10-like isoform X2 [Actinia tenebrosa]|nr:transmembrane emp24 domain-containing protein 10-like isoform X2 [Actinia tenebrosa]
MDGAKNDIPVKGEYYVSHNDRYAVKLTIKDARPDVNDLLYNKDNADKGKFAFTFDFDGVMEICFENKAPAGSGADRIVSLNVFLGFETKDYKDIATAQKLAPEEANVMRLSDMSQDLIKSFGWLIVKGDERHIANESTSGHILYLGTFLSFLLVALTAGQLIYLHRFFSSKKLI